MKIGLLDIVREGHIGKSSIWKSMSEVWTFASKVEQKL